MEVEEVQTLIQKEKLTKALMNRFDEIERTEMKVKVMYAMDFCLKDSVGRRLEGYTALYETKNRGRGREKKSNSIAFKCIIH